MKIKTLVALHSFDMKMYFYDTHTIHYMMILLAKLRYSGGNLGRPRIISLSF